MLVRTTNRPLKAKHYSVFSLSFLLLILFIIFSHNITMNLLQIRVCALFFKLYKLFLTSCPAPLFFLSRSFPKKSKIQFRIKILLLLRKVYRHSPFKELSVIIEENLLGKNLPLRFLIDIFSTVFSILNFLNKTQILCIVKNHRMTLIH